ncbi:MAG: hypothetical protein JWR65_2096 [Massilia sp.]|jgi:hypothetical protein|nr:hypothetical protein [Massilia sp.]
MCRCGIEPSQPDADVKMDGILAGAIHELAARCRQLPIHHAAWLVLPAGAGLSKAAINAASFDFAARRWRSLTWP